jgi:hypothetical protein
MKKADEAINGLRKIHYEINNPPVPPTVEVLADLEAENFLSELIHSRLLGAFRLWIFSRRGGKQTQASMCRDHLQHLFDLTKTEDKALENETFIEVRDLIRKVATGSDVGGYSRVSLRAKTKLGECEFPQSKEVINPQDKFVENLRNEEHVQATEDPKVNFIDKPKIKLRRAIHQRSKSSHVVSQKPPNEEFADNLVQYLQENYQDPSIYSVVSDPPVLFNLNSPGDAHATAVLRARIDEIYRYFYHSNHFEKLLSILLKKANERQKLAHPIPATEKKREEPSANEEPHAKDPALGKLDFHRNKWHLRDPHAPIGKLPNDPIFNPGAILNAKKGIVSRVVQEIIAQPTPLVSTGKIEQEDSQPIVDNSRKTRFLDKLKSSITGENTDVVHSRPDIDKLSWRAKRRAESEQHNAALTAATVKKDEGATELIRRINSVSRVNSAQGVSKFISKVLEKESQFDTVEWERARIQLKSKDNRIIVGKKPPEHASVTLSRVSVKLPEPTAKSKADKFKRQLLNKMSKEGALRHARKLDTTMNIHSKINIVKKSSVHIPENSEAQQELLQSINPVLSEAASNSAVRNSLDSRIDNMKLTLFTQECDSLRAGINRDRKEVRRDKKELSTDIRKVGELARVGVSDLKADLMLFKNMLGKVDRMRDRVNKGTWLDHAAMKALQLNHLES